MSSFQVQRITRTLMTPMKDDGFVLAELKF